MFHLLAAAQKRGTCRLCTRILPFLGGGVGVGWGDLPVFGAIKEDAMIFKTFFLHAPDLFGSQTPSVNGVKLQTRKRFSHSPTETMCLGPHCQCSGKEEKGSVVDALLRWKRGSRRKRVAMPGYVLSADARQMKVRGECTKEWLT